MLIHVKKGANVFLGAPATPLPPSYVAAIKNVVFQQEWILEAHMPQCYVRDVMPRPAQVLVVITKVEVAEAVTKLEEKISELSSPSGYLDIWPLTESSDLLANVRGADQMIFSRMSG